MFERSTLRALVEYKLDKGIQEFVACHEQGLRENGIDPNEYPDFIWMLIAEAAAAHFVKKLAKKATTSQS